MVFTTHIFVFYFLPLVLLIYYCPAAVRNAFLTIASYVFYGWWEPWFVLLMMTSTVVDYICGGIIATPGASATRRRTALVTAIVCDLTSAGVLQILRILGGESECVAARLWRRRAAGAKNHASDRYFLLHLREHELHHRRVPRGGAAGHDRSPILSCFISLFPHLVAGPIVRYNVVADQIADREHTREKFTHGVALFILGFAKKTLLANPMGTVADSVFAAQSPLALDAWVGVIAYAFQIYFDFSGYSDMAVGLSRMFGFVIPKNFASPYLAESITDFWRRWHISLSTWLRDYLYIPLGGNRKGPRRTYINLAAIMLLGGLWHGANWTFVVWGAYHGSLLAFERWRGKTAPYDWLPRGARVAFTFVLVLISWVLFRSPTITAAIHYLGAMAGANSSAGPAILLGAEIYTPYSLAILGLCALLSFQRLEVYDWVERLDWPRAFALVPLFLLAIAAMFTQGLNPFLYFQF